MGIPQVTTAFCGRSLRTASLFIAWCFAILVGIVWSLYLSLLPALYNIFENLWINDRFINQGLVSIIWMTLTYSFIAHCLLLYGVLKKQRYFFLPWMVITFLNIAIGIIVAGTFLIVIFSGQLLGFLFCIPNSLLSSCLIYCFLVIYSYYHEISKETGIENSPV